MATPKEILDLAFNTVSEDINLGHIADSTQQQQIEYICRCLSNRGVVRALMACLLAKLHLPAVDIRKPYTAIGGEDCYAGRPIDELYVSQFIAKHELPCNRTTGFLSPALRNHDETLFRHPSPVGRPRDLYDNFVALLNDIYEEKVSPWTILCEVVRQLIIYRDERNQRLSSLLNNLENSDPSVLSVRAIVNIIQTHTEQPYASRLPVLAILAIYKACPLLP